MALRDVISAPNKFAVAPRLSEACPGSRNSRIHNFSPAAHPVVVMFGSAAVFHREAVPCAASVTVLAVFHAGSMVSPTAVHAVCICQTTLLLVAAVFQSTSTSIAPVQSDGKI